ncbi:MAG TPA: glyoxalase [Acidimicrobiia bacterium]|nr:glyoxalase [Acidimicrobiia bacterium]
MESRALLGLEVAVAPDAWRSIGFAVDDGSVCSVDGVAIRLGAAGRKISAWSLDGVASGTVVDGLITAYAPVGSAMTAHPNGTVALDHLVVLSPAPERTITALAEHGIEPRGRRHTDQYGPPFTQTFFRVGRPVLELIGPDEPTGDEPARFYGLAFTVADLDATAAFLGDRLGRVKDAVQPGRRIATLRKEAGAGVPIAFMSPEPS